MHKLSTSFILGFHGCDVTVAEKLLSGAPFESSENDYDWLGHGAYFWENNPKRAMQFANEASQRSDSRIVTPTVVGAVIDLGLCLDMTTQYSIECVKLAYESFVSTFKEGSSDVEFPKNKSVGLSVDVLLRDLDCAVINHFHEMFLKEHGMSVDSVRGIFLEGKPIYSGSGFVEKTHIQIAVRNLACIKGVFRVCQDEFMLENEA